MNDHPSAFPELLAREDEQRILAAAVDALMAGRGHVVLIAGEPGIGKSSLARWAAQHAADAGITVGWGFCWEAGRAPPYWPWTQCLRTIVHQREIPAARLRPVAQLLPEFPGDRTAASLEPEQARFQMLEAARGLLEAVASQGPVVAILEDLHAADYDSLTLLQFLGMHLGAAPVLLIGTFREGEAQLSTETSPLWRCARSATVLRPRGFDEHTIAAYLQRSGKAPDREGLAQRILDVTEGNPLFVAEISALLGRDGKDSLAPALPANLRQVIGQHLATLPGDCLARLEDASVLGREFDLSALAQLAGLPEAGLAEDLQPAVTAGLLRVAGTASLRFTHIFYRDALYANLNPARRSALHRRRASVLQAAIDAGLSAHWAELAEHLGAAGPAHRAMSASAWRQAARHARERLAFTEACQLYNRALEVFGAGPGADPTARCELILEWARVELETGRLETGRELCSEVFRLADALESPELLANAALTYGSVFTIGRVDPVLIRFLRRALAVQRDCDDALRARLQARLAAAQQPAADPSEPMRMAHEAIGLARRSGDRRALFDTLASAVSALMDFAPAGERAPLNREYAELARENDDITAAFRAHTLMIIDAIELADAPRLEFAIDTCEQLARHIDLPHYHWRVESGRALQAALRGDFETAGKRMASARAYAERAGDPLARITLAIQDFCLMSDAGETDRERSDQAQRRIEQAIAAGQVDDLFVRPLIARHLLRLGDRAAADAVCGPGAIGRLIEMREISNIAVLGECAVLARDEPLARRVLPVLEPHAAMCSHGGLYGMTWNGPVAWTLASLCRLVGESGAAEAYLGQALGLAECLGAQRLAERIRAELRAPEPHAAPAVRQVPSARGLVLEPDGEIYRLGFDGQEALLQPSRGMELLARLVASPGRDWHVLDLAAPPEAGAALRDDAGSGPLLDEAARTEYRKRLAEIDADLDEAREREDDDLADNLLREQEFLQRELGRAYGLGGRERPAGKAAERARVNVTRRLRDAIRRIGEQLPEAGRFLDRHVTTGRFCRYDPD